MNKALAHTLIKVFQLGADYAIQHIQTHRPTDKEVAEYLKALGWDIREENSNND